VSRHRPLSTLAVVSSLAAPLVLGAGPLACGAASTAPVSGRSASGSASGSGASSTGGASVTASRDLVLPKSKFAFFASAARNVADVLALDDGSSLLVNEGGVRFVAKGDPAVVQSADSFAPEELVAVRKLASGKLAFLAASGAVYLADGPLTPFSTVRDAPKDARRAVAGKSAFFVITNAGGLLRSIDGGASWSPVALPKREGVLVDLAVDRTGEGLALLVPEQLLETRDDGASFTLLATPPVGATRVERADAPAGVFVTASTLYKGSWSTTFSTEARALVRDAGGTGAARLEAKKGLHRYAPSMPSLASGDAAYGFAEAIAGGRAALVGTTYVELLPAEEEQSFLTLAKIELPSGATTKLVTPAKECSVSAFAAAGSFYAIACTQSVQVKDEYRTDLVVYGSEDAGKTWKTLGSVAPAGNEPAVHVSVTAKGAVVVGPAAMSNKDGQVLNSTVVRPAGGTFRPLEATPKRSIDVARVASNAAGDRIYAVGTEASADAEGDARQVLLVSTDGGAHFAARPFPVTDQQLFGGADTLVVEETGASTPTVHVFSSYETSTRWTTRDDGAHFEITNLPQTLRGLAFGGRHGLAYLDSGKAIETPDFGLTWGLVEVPSATSYACTESGCLVGDSAYRSGFELAKPADAKPMPSQVELEKAGQKKLEAASAWKCTVEPAGTKLRDGAPAAVLPRVGVPWLGSTSDGATATAKVVETSFGKDGALALKEVPLFAAALSAGKGEPVFALRASAQGVFAVRYRYDRPGATPAVTKPLAKPPGSAKPPKPSAAASAKPVGSAGAKPPTPPKPELLRADVEVAWYVAATGKVVHATIPAAEGLDPKEHLTAKKGWSEAKTTGWIVPGHGLVVRPFAARLDEPLWLVGEGGKVTRLPALAQPGFRTYAAVRGVGALHLLGMNDRAGLVFVATLADGAKDWKTRVVTAWSERGPSPYATTLDAFGAGADASFAFGTSGDATFAPHGWALGLRDDVALEPIALPTQRDLSQPARACSDKRTGVAPARVNVPFAFGTRHPVLLVDGKSTRMLATWDAVALVDRAAPSAPGNACVGAFDASRPGYPGGEWVAIDPAALDHAVSVRDVYENGARALEVRKASCAPTTDDVKSFASSTGFSR
jgi:hypothetical protein